MGNIVSRFRSVQKRSNNYGNDHVLCDECVKTYKPYTYRETLRRALVSSVDEWKGVDDKDHITGRYSEYWTEFGSTYNEQFYFNEYGYRSYKNIKEAIRNLFPCVDDLRACHAKFSKERRNKIFATFLCFDCEKYLCAKCITGHSEHFTFSEDDKNNTGTWDKIETKIMEAFNADVVTKQGYIRQERADLCDVVDVKDSLSVAEWEKFMSRVEQDIYELGYELDRYYVARNICILKDNQALLTINYWSTRMKIYNTSSCELIDTIELPYRPAGITEIPPTDLSQTVIAVSFPDAGQIKIMDIQRRPAEVISSINVRGKCYDLAYCNNKLITRCEDCLDREGRHFIHVMEMSGEINSIISLKKLTELQPELPYIFSCSLHSESETFYVCLRNYGVICLSLRGQVLHSTRFTDPRPFNMCVDRYQNVYVMGNSFPLYRLSSDLSERVTIYEAVNVSRVSTIAHHKNKIYMASAEGYVYIFNVD